MAVENSSGDGALRASTAAGIALRIVRNGRVLVTAGLRHLVDDPALLAIQVSRRLPVGPRITLGRALEKAGAVIPAAGALGSVMAGHEALAEAAVERTDLNSGSLASRLAGEVAILLDRTELIPPTAPAPTRARAAWFRGDLSEAVDILERAEHGQSRYARRLRSEVQLLRPGFRLPVPELPRDAVPAPLREGEPLRVLHLLTNSLPHTQSGYSLRSHRILTALRDRGIEGGVIASRQHSRSAGV